MIKIAAISGLIIAGITITIFMGPCDPIENIKPPPFNSPRGENHPRGNPLDWIKERKCGLPKPSGSSKETEASPSAEPSDSSTPKAPISPSSAKKSTSNTSTIIGRMSGPIGATEVTILPQPGVKLSDYAPLKAEVIVGNKLVWQATINKSDCKETASFPGCNIPGYKYSSDWDGLTFDMKVYDKDNILRASFYKKTSTPWKPSCSGSDCPPPFIKAPLP